MKEFIEEKLVDYFKKCSVDKYGQVKVIDLYNLFKDSTNDVIEYVKTNDELLRITTYGWRYGTYKGISPDYDILDDSLRKKCYDTLSKYNENYRYAMTH
jgi:hypothetical protein